MAFAYSSNVWDEDTATQMLFLAGALHATFNGSSVWVERRALDEAVAHSIHEDSRVRGYSLLDPGFSPSRGCQAGSR